MTIDLSPELEAQLRQQATASGFEDLQAYVEEILRSSIAVAEWVPDDLEDVRARIQEGWDQSQRGELVTSEEVWKSLEETKSAFRAARGQDAA